MVRLHACRIQTSLKCAVQSRRAFYLWLNNIFNRLDYNIEKTRGECQKRAQQVPTNMDLYPRKRQTHEFCFLFQFVEELTRIDDRLLGLKGWYQIKPQQRH